MKLSKAIIKLLGSPLFQLLSNSSAYGSSSSFPIHSTLIKRASFPYCVVSIFLNVEKNWYEGSGIKYCSATQRKDFP